MDTLNTALELAEKIRGSRLCKGGRGVKHKRTQIIKIILETIKPPTETLLNNLDRIRTIATPKAFYWTELYTDIEDEFKNLHDQEARKIIDKALQTYKTILQTKILETQNCTQQEDKAALFLLIAALEALKEPNLQDTLTTVENYLVEPYRSDYTRAPLIIHTNTNILTKIDLAALNEQLQDIANTIRIEEGDTDAVAILPPRIIGKESTTKRLTIIYYTKIKEQPQKEIINGKVQTTVRPIIKKTTIIIVPEENKTTAYILYSRKLTTLQKKVLTKILETLGLPQELEQKRTLRKDLDPKKIIEESIKENIEDPHSLLARAHEKIKEKISGQLRNLENQELREALENMEPTKLSISDSYERHVRFNLTISYEETPEQTPKIAAHTAAAKTGLIKRILEIIKNSESSTITITLSTKYKDRKVKLELVHKADTRYYTHNFPKHLIHEIHSIIGE